jgi:hypothetical protein
MKQVLAWILLAGLTCWLMFSPMYRHVAVMRHSLLQQEVDYLLEIGASGAYGYIDEQMIRESKMRLAARGFDPDLLVYEVSSTTGDNAGNPLAPLRRGTGITLSIRYPYGGLFLIDRLIGSSGAWESRDMSAFGIKMSEYVPAPFP